jgi:hypothetical protein
MLPRRIPKPEGVSKTFGRAANGVPRKYLFEQVLPYSGNECLIWPFARTSDGYGGVWVDGKHYVVSRLVCEHLHGRLPSEQPAGATASGARELRA